MMYRLLFLAVFLCCAPLSFAKGEVAVEDTYEYDLLVSTISGYGAPFLSGNSVVFTAKPDARYIGIAFDFENFREIHSFQLKKIYDIDGEVTNSFFFYVLDLPKSVSNIEYRLVVDGLWTTDPLNPKTVYKPSSGLTLSKLALNRNLIPETEVRKVSGTSKDENGVVHFVYRGKPGQHIRLGGTFTNWDSWIYELDETEPGIYQIDLPLPPGTYYYSFFNGVSSMVDTSNPDRGYTADGKVASVITVK